MTRGGEALPRPPARHFALHQNDMRRRVAAPYVLSVCSESWSGFDEGSQVFCAVGSAQFGERACFDLSDAFSGE